MIPLKRYDYLEWWLGGHNMDVLAELLVSVKFGKIENYSCFVLWMIMITQLVSSGFQRYRDANNGEWYYLSNPTTYNGGGLVTIGTFWQNCYCLSNSKKSKIAVVGCRGWFLLLLFFSTDFDGLGIDITAKDTNNSKRILKITPIWLQRGPFGTFVTTKR